MDDILKDKRFSKLVNDPKYRQISKKDRKVKIDQRFQSMFNNDKFKIKYSVDKRGRPVQQTSSENLKKYYELGSDGSDSENEESASKEDDKDAPSTPGQYVLRRKSDEDEENEKSEPEDGEATKKVKNDVLERGKLDAQIKNKLRDLDIDYARGEAALFSEEDSSSDDETSEEEDEGLEHAWGELDADAETTDEATCRLAICNMDWDNIKAVDLFVLFNSFLPPGGALKSVTIYPSEFGQKRLQEEELKGPIELTETKKNSDSDDDENEEGAKYHMEKLRVYQLNRLKYYYAVAVFDSSITANKIYTDCDGIEYESSSAKLDLRFIPDDVTFEQEVHDECTELPDTNKYKPRMFTTTALQQAKVELTWDSANPHRVQTLKNAADGDIQDEDLRNYLACSSDEEYEEEKEQPIEEEKDEEVDPISKYKALLGEIEESEKKKKNRGVEMEISWGMGLKQKTEELVKKKINKGDQMTPFEELIEKKKEKKKAKKLERKKQIEKAKKGSGSEEENEGYSSDDIPSDIDMNDPYFAEEFQTPEFKKPNKSKKLSKAKKLVDNSDEEEHRKKAELELLLDDDDGKQHFSLKKIQDAENETKSKKKRKYKEKLKQKMQGKEENVDNFEIDTKDERFSALFTSHHYNIDPSDPNFKKTKNMDKLIQEKFKRRPAETVVAEDRPISKKTKMDPSLNVLVKSIKRKSQNTNG